MAAKSFQQLERANCGENPLAKHVCCFPYTPDGRHLVYGHLQHIWLLDLFHMLKKKFSIVYDRNIRDTTKSKPRSGVVKRVQLIDNDHVLMFLYDIQKSTEWYVIATGKLDYERLKCVITQLEPYDCSIVWELPFMRYVSSATDLGVFSLAEINNRRVRVYTKLNVTKGELTRTKTIAYPRKGRFTIDGCIYAFASKNRHKYSKLRKFNMETKKRTTLKLENCPSPLPECKLVYNQSVSVGRKIVVALIDYKLGPKLYVRYRLTNRLAPRLLILDLDLLQWSELKWELKGEICRLVSDNDNILVVNTSKWDCDKLYRFAINRPDRLSTISWLTIRNYVKKFPHLDRHFTSLLPKNSAFRCTFESCSSTEPLASNSPQLVSNCLQSKNPLLNNNDETSASTSSGLN